MKLFVIGSKSPNPEYWSRWDEVALVIADTVEEAKELTSKGNFEESCEIPLDKAQLLIQMTEPNMGEDL